MRARMQRCVRRGQNPNAQSQLGKAATLSMRVRVRARTSAGTEARGSEAGPIDGECARCARGEQSGEDHLDELAAVGGSATRSREEAAETRLRESRVEAQRPVVIEVAIDLNVHTGVGAVGGAERAFDHFTVAAHESTRHELGGVRAASEWREGRRGRCRQRCARGESER